MAGRTNGYYNDPNIGAGMSSLASIFAPPSPQELVAGANLQIKRATDARTASALENIRAGRSSVADYLTVDPSGGVGQYGRADMYRRYQADPTMTPDKMDTPTYILGGKAGDTFAGQQAQPLNPGQVRVLAPRMAASMGVPSTQYGVIQTNKDQTTNVPGPGGRMAAPEGQDPVAAAVMASGPRAPAEDGTPPPTRPADPIAAAAMRSGQPQRGGARPTGQFTIEGKTDEPARPITDKERTEHRIPANAPAAWVKGEPKMLGSPGTNLTVNNAVNPILQGLGGQFVEQAAEARAAANTARSIQTVRAQLDAPGGLISGQFANNILALQKVGAAFGVVDPSAIQNTETFTTQIKPIVLETVKGLGAGSGISNADREFALQAVGGDIRLDEGAIRRVLDITERAARAKIDRHNKLADQMLETQPELRQIGPMLRIEAPVAAAVEAGTGQPAAGPAQAAPAVQPSGGARPSSQPDASGWQDAGDGVKIRRKQ